MFSVFRRDEVDFQVIEYTAFQNLVNVGPLIGVEHDGDVIMGGVEQCAVVSKGAVGVLLHGLTEATYVPMSIGVLQHVGLVNVGFGCSGSQSSLQQS